MHDASFPYSEEILQNIWHYLLFDLRNLKTECGQAVSVIKHGTLNPTDGPDFKNAEIRLNGEILKGDIEIHVSAADWYHHNHHTDDNYNNVILHVIADVNPSEVYVRGGYRIPALNLIRRIRNDAIDFVRELNKAVSIPCAVNQHFISEDAFSKQIDKAHNEYFEKKTNDLISFYDPSFGISGAFKKALIKAIFDGLGIPHNREQMKAAAEWLIRNITDGELPRIQEMMNFCGFGDRAGAVKWNMKGVYPANHPRVRVLQAYRMAESVYSTGFSIFYGENATGLWFKWISDAHIQTHYKSRVLYATVFLPALYLCSTLVGSDALKSRVFEEWRTYTVELPYSIRKKLAVLPDVLQKKACFKLGAVHQLRAYCGERRCKECFVLKKAILP